MILSINDQVHLTEIKASDQDALIEHLNEKEISSNMMNLPYPFIEKDARDFITVNNQKLKKIGSPVNFAIRNKEEYLIGTCGFPSILSKKIDSPELAYWLAKAYWGQGITTKVVKVVCDYAFAEMEIKYIIAHTLTSNTSSMRVLEKCGFKLEACIRAHFLTGDDANFYTKEREDEQEKREE